MFALILAPLLLAAGGPPAYLAACPTADARVLTPPVLNAPAVVQATNRRTRVLLDLGSDGRVRRVAMVESSGDAGFDAAAIAAAQHMTFEPPQEGCISPSSVAPESFDVPLIALARRAPGTTGVPVLPSTLPASDTICAAPMVELTGLAIPDARQAPGTVAVDVSLSATGHVLGAQLARSSGNKTTDATALEMARDGEYTFTPQPGCASKATTYRLELTYH
jgi:TonB family protein